MTANDIEQLFTRELGLYDVVVTNYDKVNKTIDMNIIIDFKETFGDKKTKFREAFVTYFKNLEDYFFVVDNVLDGTFSTVGIEIKNNKIMMDIKTPEYLKLYDYLKEFFFHFLKLHGVI